MNKLEKCYAKTCRKPLNSKDNLNAKKHKFATNVHLILYSLYLAYLAQNKFPIVFR